MKLEHVAPIGHEVAVVLPRHADGFFALRPSVGSVARSAISGRTVFRDTQGEHEQWELHAAFDVRTIDGQELRDLWLLQQREGDFTMDRRVRSFLREVYEDGGTGNPYAIVQGCWVDRPDCPGFKDRDGVYLILPGSNTAYGSWWGGFPHPGAASAYAEKHGLDGWEVIDRRRPLDQLVPVDGQDIETAGPRRR